MAGLLELGDESLEETWGQTYEQCAGTETMCTPFLHEQTAVYKGRNCGGNVQTSSRDDCG